MGTVKRERENSAGDARQMKAKFGRTGRNNVRVCSYAGNFFIDFISSYIGILDTCLMKSTIDVSLTVNSLSGKFHYRLKKSAFPGLAETEIKSMA